MPNAQNAILQDVVQIFNSSTQSTPPLRNEQFADLDGAHQSKHISQPLAIDSLTVSFIKGSTQTLKTFSWNASSNVYSVPVPPVTRDSRFVVILAVPWLFGAFVHIRLGA